MRLSFKAGMMATIIGSTFASERSQKVMKGKDNPLDQTFKDLVGNSLEKWHVPGVSVAVVDGDETWADVSNSQV